jgi:hypothetical protein
MIQRIILICKGYLLKVTVEDLLIGACAVEINSEMPELKGFIEGVNQGMNSSFLGHW